MQSVLEQAYGSAAMSDPGVKLMGDIIAFMPWWYPLMWAGIIGSVVLYKAVRKWRVRQQTKMGVARVKLRGDRLAAEATEDHRLAFILRRPANDVGPLVDGQLQTG